MKAKKNKLDYLIADYNGRAYLPQAQSVATAKKALSEMGPAPLYARRSILTAAWALSIVAIIIISALLFLFPPQTTYAANPGLEIYVNQTFPQRMNYEVVSCYDIKIGDSSVGAMINMVAAPDEKRGGDELWIIIEYYSKYELADARFRDLPLYSDPDSNKEFNAKMFLENDEFVTLAVFFKDGIRVCVEIRSGENINSVEKGSFGDYTKIFSFWPELFIHSR